MLLEEETAPMPQFTIAFPREFECSANPAKYNNANGAG